MKQSKYTVSHPDRSTKSIHVSLWDALNAACDAVASRGPKDTGAYSVAPVKR